MAIVLTMVMLVPYMAHAQETNANASASTNVIANASSFVDIRGHWAEETIVKWSEQGLVKGQSADRFNPNASITRAELAALINKAAGMNEEAAIAFTDVASGKWYYIEVAKAIGAGYMQGYADGTFKPEAAISRQELAVLIVRLLGIEEQEPAATYADVANAPAWSRGAIGAVIEAGIMSGKSEGQFSPLTPTTRAEAVVILDRIVDKLAAPAAPALTVTYDEAGTYGGETPETIEGAVIISAADVVLRNTTVAGDLTITKAVDEGDVTLNGVTVRGRTLIQGGGANSVHIENSSLGEVEVNKPGGAIRVVFDASSKAERVSLASPSRIEAAEGSEVGEVALGTGLPSGSEIVLEGSFERVVVGAQQAKLTADKGTIGELQVSKDAKGSKVELGKDSKVKQLTLDSGAAVSGEGAVEKAAINAEGATLAKKPGEVAVKDGVKASVGGQVVSGGSATTAPPAAGGGGGGGAPNPGGGVPNPGGGTQQPSTYTITGTVKSEAGELIDGLMIIYLLESPEGVKAEIVTVDRGSFSVSLKEGKYLISGVHASLENDDPTYYKWIDKTIQVSASSNKSLALTAFQSNFFPTLIFPTDWIEEEEYYLFLENLDEDEPSYALLATKDDEDLSRYIKDGTYRLTFLSAGAGEIYIGDIEFEGITNLYVRVPQLTKGYVRVDGMMPEEAVLMYTDPREEIQMVSIINGEFSVRLGNGKYTDVKVYFQHPILGEISRDLDDFSIINDGRELTFDVTGVKLQGSLVNEKGEKLNGKLEIFSMGNMRTIPVSNGVFAVDQLPEGVYSTITYTDDKGNRYLIEGSITIGDRPETVELIQKLNVKGIFTKGGLPMDNLRLIIQQDYDYPMPLPVGGVAQAYVDNGNFAIYLPEGDYVIYHYLVNDMEVQLSPPVRFKVKGESIHLPIELPAPNVTGKIYDTDGVSPFMFGSVHTYRLYPEFVPYRSSIVNGGYELYLPDGEYELSIESQQKKVFFIKPLKVSNGQPVSNPLANWTLSPLVELNLALTGAVQSTDFRVAIASHADGGAYYYDVKDGKLSLHMEPGQYFITGYELENNQYSVRLFNPIPFQVPSSTTITIPTTQ